MRDGRSIVVNIRGSTTIEELMERFPDGRALDLMARLGWPCGHCGARSTEPISLAAKRHGNPVRAVIECFRALAGGGPAAALLEAARARPRRSPDPLRAWLRSAGRYGRDGAESRGSAPVSSMGTGPREPKAGHGARVSSSTTGSGRASASREGCPEAADRLAAADRPAAVHPAAFDPNPAEPEPGAGCEPGISVSLRDTGVPPAVGRRPTVVQAGGTPAFPGRH